MWLGTMLACNLFATFYRRNLKPAARAAYDTLQIMRLMMAELYAGLCLQPGPVAEAATGLLPPHPIRFSTARRRPSRPNDFPGPLRF